MNQETEFDRVLGLIYEAALAPQELPRAVAAMTALIDGDTCHLVGWQRDSGLPSLSVMTGLPEVLGQEYATYYGALDPRRNLLVEQGPGHVMKCQDHFDDGFVSRCEFFQDYLLPRVGVRYLLAAGDLVDGSSNLILIGFQRYIGHGPFSETESATLRRLLPHLRRSLRLWSAVEKERQENRFGKAAAEISNLGVLAVSSSRMVLWANRRGEALLRGGDWFGLVNGRLQASDPGRDAALKQALRAVCADGRPRNINLGTNANGTARCCLTLVSLRGDNPMALSVSGTAVLVLATIDGEHRVASVPQLMALFGLSPAEARVVRGLAHGDTVDQYSVREGVKRTTVRTQLQAALAKTGTTSQKDIVRLVVTLPAVRDSGPN